MSAAPVTDNAARRTIGDILLAHGFVSEQALADATAEQERTAQPLGQILVRQGVISRLDLASALAEQWSDPTASITPLPPTTPGESLTLQPADDVREVAPHRDAADDLAWSEEAHREIEAIGDRVAALAERFEVAQATTQGLETELANLAELAARPAAPVVPDPLLLERVDAVSAAVDALAERPVTDETARGRVEEIAARLETLVDGAAFDDLRDALDELERRPVSDPELGVRLERVEALSADRAARAELEAQEAALGGLRAALAELEARPVGNPEVDARLAQIEAFVAERLTSVVETTELDALATRVEEIAHTMAAAPTEVIVERADDGVLTEKLEELESRLGSSAATIDELRASLNELDEQRVRNEGTAGRLETLAAAVDELLNRPDTEARFAERLEELERGFETVSAASAVADLRVIVEGLVDSGATGGTAVAELARRIDELEHAPAPETPGWADEASGLRDRIDALAVTVGDTSGRVVREPSFSGEPDEDTELELERLRMAIERMSMHLGEQERALAEVMRSRDVAGRLEALEARIDDVEEASSIGSSGGAANGAAPGAGGKEARALARRLDAAEAQFEEERERMFTKMERIASAIAWRLQRLEAIPQETLDDE